jgi:hypothetical protein
MVSKQISNPQGLYGLSWDENGRAIARYVNASGRTMYTGDAVCLTQGGNSLVQSISLQGQAAATPTTVLANTAAGAAVLVPFCSYTLINKDPTCVGIVGTYDDGYVDSMPGGFIGQVPTNVSAVGALAVGTITGPAELAAFPPGAIVPVIVFGPTRANVSNQTTAVGSLLCTAAGATYGSGVLAATPATLGNGVAVALEVNSHAGTGYQSGSGAESVTSTTIAAYTTAASGTTLFVNVAGTSAGGLAAAPYQFPTTGMLQFNDTGTLRIAGYTGITSGAIGTTGFSGISATAIQTGVVLGTTISLVIETIRVLVKSY